MARRRRKLISDQRPDARCNSLMHVRVPAEMRLAIDEVAKLENTSSSELVRAGIEIVLRFTAKEWIESLDGRTASPGRALEMIRGMRIVQWADAAVSAPPHMVKALRKALIQSK